MQKVLQILSIIIISVLFFTGCSEIDLSSSTYDQNITDDQKADSPDNWTIMVYMDGDNDLEASCIEDLNEMEGVDISGLGINIIVLMDRIQGYDTSNGNWTNTRLYRINYDPAGVNNSIISERLASAELGLSLNGNEELNMGNPLVLSQFINFGKTNFPANQYSLILWNHGSGWRSRDIESTISIEQLNESELSSDSIHNKRSLSSRSNMKAVCVDETNKDILYTAEIGAGISGQNLDVLGMDVCLGGMMEIAYEVRNDANIYVASEESEPIDGWEYNILLNIFKTTTLTEQDLAYAMVNAYAIRYSNSTGATLSAIDLSKIDNVMTSLNNLSDAIYNLCTTNSRSKAVVKTAIFESENFYLIPGDINIDLYDFAQVLFQKYNVVDNEAQAVMDAIDDAVIFEWHHQGTGAFGNPRSHGLSLHFAEVAINKTLSHDPAYFGDYTGPFPLSFVKDSTWTPASANGPGLIYRLFYEDLP